MLSPMQCHQCSVTDAVIDPVADVNIDVVTDALSTTQALTPERALAGDGMQFRVAASARDCGYLVHFLHAEDG